MQKETLFGQVYSARSAEFFLFWVRIWVKEWKTPKKQESSAEQRNSYTQTVPHRGVA